MGSTALYVLLKACKVGSCVKFEGSGARIPVFRLNSSSDGISSIPKGLQTAHTH